MPSTAATSLLPDPEPVPTGWGDLDRALGGGLPRADLVEVVSARPGQGELTLALAVAERLGAHPLLLVDLAGDLLLPTGRWPPDAVRLQPRGPAEALEVTERALRCVGVGAVVVCLEGSALRRGQQVRLRQAARSGETLALLLRYDRGSARASAAPVRLRVERPRCPGRGEVLEVTVERVRGFPGAGRVARIEV